MKERTLIGNNERREEEIELKRCATP